MRPPFVLLNTAWRYVVPPSQRPLSPAYTVVGVRGSTASEVTPGGEEPAGPGGWASPALAQRRPPFMLLKTPLPVPTYTISGAEGAKRSSTVAVGSKGDAYDNAMAEA